MNLPDYHIHTKLCNHAVGEMEDYVRQAVKVGLGEMGFSDHMPVMPESHLCMSFTELPVYVERVLELRERYRDEITIRLGCEMDIVAERMDDIRRILQTYPFDYVIGSIHYLDGWPFDQEQYSRRFTETAVEDIYERFFDAVVSAAETGVFDVVGHIDNIKCMGYRPDEEPVGLYERVASVVKECGLVVELNTSGFDKPAGEQYPSGKFIEILHRFGVPMTVGSDSHAPGHVGRYFDRALSLLEAYGYEHVTFFRNRERFQKPIRPSAADVDGTRE